MKTHVAIPSSIVAILMIAVLGCFSPEEKAWQEASAKDTALAYSEFLKIYQQGENAKKAARRIEELTFEAAEQEATLVAYNRYLAESRDGRFAEKARKAIHRLKIEEAKETLSVTDCIWRAVPLRQENPEIIEQLNQWAGYTHAMYASFTVYNGSAYAIKDFSVAIELFANSGTLVQTIASSTI
ncbi:MAG: hypothetical protein HC897_10045 [Thermoanaerobaculia bacterium]|nr:hypothetical protein [Thermoanaerobaculia bacterium]